jgi:RHS repeat-associated protein
LRYHCDARGKVAFVLGGGGQGYERYTYDAFGQPTITDWDGNVRGQSAIGNRFLFQGREWIPELGIYDFRNRMYHPRLGRFLQKDSLGFHAGDMNLFRYCGDDPVNFNDPSGERVSPAVALPLAGFALGPGTDLFVQLSSKNWDFNKVNGNEVMISGLVGVLSAGSSVFYQTAVRSIILRVALNSATSGALGGAGQAGINKSNGKPVTQNAIKSVTLNAGAGLFGGLISEIPAIQSAKAWSAASVEKRAWVISNTITAPTVEDSAFSGFLEGLALGVSNAPPIFDLSSEARPDEPLSTYFQNTGYDLFDIAARRFDLLSRQEIKFWGTYDEPNPDDANPDHY